MAARDRAVGSAVQVRWHPGRLGPGLAAAGECLSLYATVLVLVMIGGLKFTAYEAEAIRPLSRPARSCAGPMGSSVWRSRTCSVVELTTALLLAIAPFAPRLGLAGAGLAAGTFAITSTFLITGPSWEESLGGFPALSAARGFLIKDLALLGIALTVAGRMATRIVESHTPR